PDKGSRADHRLMLIEAIIVAGDRARANISLRTHMGVTDIGEVINLRTRLNARLLHLYEIADLGLFQHLRARAKPRIGTNLGTCRDGCLLEMAKGVDRGSLSHAYARTEPDIWLDDRVGANLRIMRQEHRFGRNHSDAFQHQVAAATSLPYAFRLSKFGAVVHAKRILERRLYRADRKTILDRDLDDLRQVIFALRVVVADPVEQRQRMLTGNCHDAAIAEANAALFLGTILILADRHQRPIRFDQATVARRIFDTEAHHSNRCAFRQHFAHGNKGRRVDQRRIAEHDQHVVIAAGNRPSRG